MAPQLVAGDALHILPHCWAPEGDPGSCQAELLMADHSTLAQWWLEHEPR